MEKNFLLFSDAITIAYVVNQGKLQKKISKFERKMIGSKTKMKKIKQICVEISSTLGSKRKVRKWEVENPKKGPIRAQFLKKTKNRGVKMN